MSKDPKSRISDWIQWVMVRSLHAIIKARFVAESRISAFYEISRPNYNVYVPNSSRMLFPSLYVEDFAIPLGPWFYVGLPKIVS